MSDNRDEGRRKLGRIADSLARDVDRLTDEELLREAEEEFGDPEKAVLATKDLIQRAISAHGKRRLTAAREAYMAARSGGRLQVFELSPERKRELIDRFASNDDRLREKLTMAARNQEDLEADIDSILEDLIELGAIDEEGNIR